MQFLQNSKTFAIATLMLLAGHSVYAQVNRQDTPSQTISGSREASVTAVSGESWLAHLNRSFNETSMGKTGHLGPPAAAPGETDPQWQPLSSSGLPPQTVTLHGSDLYRLNCQGCHGESGQGAPPEINSVINPVRATSVALVMERMKQSGMDISRAEAVKLAQQSNTALLLRLHQGGQDMPSFPHLNEAEIRSLFAYLKLLAGVPGAEREQVAVKESPLHVGEHIVKSTCHTCHGATGPDPNPQQLWDGAIPPLSTLTTRKSRPGFIQKVTHGAPILMGAQPMLYRGRMPVFYYLSEQEAEDVYLYLSLYPPSDSATTDTTIALSQHRSEAGGGTTPPLQKAGSRSFVLPQSPTGHPDTSSDLQEVVLLSMVGALVILLLAGGLGFTIREFHRLSAASQVSSLAVKTKHKERTEDATPTLQGVS
ncbi:MAG: cytochrome c [Candidatus Korobacteraceae bacterium]